jgi:hypothetical protein
MLPVLAREDCLKFGAGLDAELVECVRRQPDPWARHDRDPGDNLDHRDHNPPQHGARRRRTRARNAPHPLSAKYVSITIP